ncbi:MAG: hypothetical protein R3C69_16050 [Geminicoccaceae bacterium]
MTAACAALALAGVVPAASAEFRDDVLHHQRWTRGRAPISAGSRVPTLLPNLAEAVGAGGHTWRALSGLGRGRPARPHRHRPLAQCRGRAHRRECRRPAGDANAISKETGLTEKGEVVNGRGDTPNRHDILTGANADGTTAAGQTCGDWTLSGEGTAMVGHHDRMGLRDDAPSRSWNASHGSRGCSQEALQGTGGDGLLYCFAAD